MAVAFPDNQMQVLPYNRVVTDLRGLTPAAFLDALKKTLSVRDGGPATPSGKGSIAMYLDGAWHTIAMPAGSDALDVDLLQTAILEPLLGIADVRTDKRIDFVGGIRGTSELEQLVNCRKVRGGVFAVSGLRRRSHAHRRRRRHHAAEVHLVRAQASRRASLARDLT